MDRGGRITWLDTAKCLGIFMVYIGHFGAEAGLIYSFVFQFHVPFFFFLSGCARRLSSRSPLADIRKATVSLLVPFFLFGLFYLLFFALITESREDVLAQLVILLKGATRNQFAAGSLWFLSCLWLIEIAFSFVQRLKPILLLLLSITLYLIATKLLATNPLVEPRLWYNVDSAMAYFLYFVLGYLVMPWIGIWFQADQRKKTVFLHGTGIVCLVYAMFVYVTQAKLHVNWYLTIPGYDIYGTIIHVLILIYAALYAARMLQSVEGLSLAGQDTLFLCGNEDVTRMVFPMIWKTFGGSIQIQNPVYALAYCFGLIWIERRTIIPIEKQLYRKMRAYLIH